MRLPVFLLFFAGSLTAQPLTVGLKFGAPFIDANGPGGNSPKIAAGASIEVALPARFAVELSAIHRRTDQPVLYLPSPGQFSTGVFDQTRGSSWEFPLLGKYYFRSRTTHWQPFLGAGAAFRTIGYRMQGATLSLPDTGGIKASGFDVDNRPDPAFGGVLAAGVRFRSGRFAITPEFRVTRWGEQGLTVRRNDPGLYVGFTF